MHDSSLAKEVFAVGSSGTVLHFDGASWTNVPAGTTSSFNDVRGGSGSDVFAVGKGGTVIHFDGNAWSEIRGSLLVKQSGFRISCRKVIVPSG